MLNPQAVAHQSVEIIDGSISEYYEMVDSALRPSEVCPAKYNTTTSPSYQNQCPCVQGSFTTVDIGCADPNVVLMEKSFIAPTVSFDITSSVDITTASLLYTANPSVFFVGWKRSLDVFYKYSILYNGSEVFDQTYNGEESFVIQTIMKDDVREKRPNQLTSYRNASSLNRDVCGTYVLFSEGRSTAHVTIPVKITLADFPFFTQFNYLMGWMGNWSIRMYPDSRNIVTCQVNPEYTVGKLNAIYCDAEYEHGFVQIGDSFMGITAYTPPVTTGNNIAAGTWTLSNMKFTVSNYQFDACDINLTQQVMWRPYYEQIMAKYMQKPLMIPFLSFIFGRFSQQMTKKNGMHSVFSGVIKCCEAMFVIPFIDDNHHTVCKNPKFGNLYANVGAYGNYPQNPIDTYCNGDNERSFLRFINMTNDALGLEYSPLISMNEDLSNSLHAAIHKIYIAGTAPSEIKYDKSDATNFLIGFPFADEADFQGGLTTGGNINIQIHAGTSNFGDIMPASQSLSIGPTAIFMCDHVVMLQPAPSGLPALVKIETNKVN